MARTLSLVVRNLVFTVVVPGLGGVWVPWWIATGYGAHGGHGVAVAAAGWAAIPVIAAGTALYAWCVWNFAAVGRGTPGPWDAPSRVVAAGPYRWVRNPIYLAALLVVLGEAWLFMSLWLLAYAGLMAVGLGLDDAIGLALALDRMPGRLIVHAIEAADLSQGPGLTPEAAAAVGPVASAILDDLRAVRG
jgi:protein-S-isoprenylcysteine O-methyltransferase Ste14